MIDSLNKALSAALHSLYDIQINPDDIRLDITRKEFEGDFTFVVFPYLRQSKKGPEHTAQELGEAVVSAVEQLEKYNVVKGFLNLSFKSSVWVDWLTSANITSIRTAHGSPRKIMVEYSSPNTNKPLHLGHVRNNVLGFSICQILQQYGHEVIKVNLINDRGIHICKSMLSYHLFGDGETPESSGLKGDHFVGKYYVLFDVKNREQAAKLVEQGMDPEEAKNNTPLMEQTREWLRKWEEQDSEIRSLWSTMNGWVYDGFHSTYDRMGVSFDKFYHESETYLLGKDLVMEGLSSGELYQKEDGSVWIDLTADGLDQKILLRSDGTSVYMTQDIGTAQLKYDDYHMDQSVYVVGNEQDYHFQVLKATLKRLGKAYADGVFHMSYGMVELPEGKLKTREGKVVDADDLMDEMYATAKERTNEQGKTDGMEADELNTLYEQLGLGALKYFLLRVDPVKRILFNPAESIDFQGNTGTFIQYTHARCQSILRSISFDGSVTLPDHLEAEERALVAHFHQYDDKLAEAATNFSPAVMANYLYETAKLFNSFYNQHSILKAESENIKQLRILLTQRTAETLRVCGRLLGMEMPERM